ncbi:MAG TPA: nickel insertion protein [Candidatus Tectomicrobia bacterium]
MRVAYSEVVGVVLGLHALGIYMVMASLIKPGYDSTHAANGRLPVPALVTSELVTGFHSSAGIIRQEMTRSFHCASREVRRAQHVNPI